MPEMQSSAPVSAGLPPANYEAVQRSLSEDPDYALGCECANPALQIERWGLEPGPGAEPN